MYEIQAWGRGFVTYKIKVTLVAGAVEVIDIPLKVDSLGGEPDVKNEISGVIAVKDGAVLSEAAVVLISAFDQEILDRARTDQSGRFRLRGTGNQFILLAYKPGYEINVRRVVIIHPLSTQPQDYDLILQPLKLP
ncbi:MAG: carboxypeptidase-like regulatory domain-containing protein [Blastocatellia bacterium]|nr:carboxypeptidase-like regulatory domain-containing protein [Blastocatellia bacterium]